MVFLDMRHFAKNTPSSAATDNVSVDAYVADIENACLTLGLTRFVLVGHSHHGNLALEYAKRHPERVSHLVLIGTPPCNVRQTIEASQLYWKDHASDKRKTIVKHNRAVFNSFDAQVATAETFVAEYVAEGPKYWQDPYYDATWLWQDVPVNMDLIKQFRNFFTDYEFSLELVALTAPVLAIMGRYDYAVPPFLWSAGLTDLYNVTLHLFEHSGHTPQLEEQELFDQVFLGWLERTPLNRS